MTFISGIRFAIFDVAGTTVIDDGIVVEAFMDAITTFEKREAVIQDYVRIARETMGERKIDVFQKMFDDDSKAQGAHELFTQSYLSRVNRGEIIPMPGAESLFRELRDRNISIGLNTGFSREILDSIIVALDWQRFIDFAIASSEVQRGRPAPDMLQSLIDNFNARAATEISAKNVIVFGDTTSDVLAGKAAGVALTVGVESGAHSRETLIDAGADYVLEHIYDAIKFFEK